MASFRGLMTFAKPVRATPPFSGAIPTGDDGTSYYATAPVEVNKLSPVRRAQHARSVTIAAPTAVPGAARLSVENADLDMHGVR